MNKLLLSYLLTIGISASTGAATGIILKRTVGPIDEMYPPGFDPKEFSPNVSEIMARYEKLSDQSITGVSTFPESDVVNIILEKYRTSNECYSIGIGVANVPSVGVKQSIRSAQIKIGNEYFEEQISLSKYAEVAKRTAQHGKDGEIDFYNGKPINEEKATYPETPKKYTKANYKKFLGKTLDEMFIYIISEKTTLKSSRTNKGNEVVIDLELNPNLSTYYYKTQMLNISGLANLPPFSEVKLQFTCTKDLELTHLKVDETYTATKDNIPVPAETHNIINYYYHVGTSIDIPDYQTPINYKIQEA